MTGRLLRIAVLLLCAALLWRAVDWAEAGRLLQGASLAWLAGALFLLTLQTAISAERWRITAAQLGARFGFGYALREYYLAQALNQALPGGVLGDAGRAVRARAQAGLLASGQAVVFERLAGQLGLLALLVTGLIATAATLGPGDWPNWLEVVGAVVCVAVVLILALAVLAGRYSASVRRAWAPFLQAIFARTVWRRQVVSSLATALCNVAAFAFCAIAVGAPMSPLVAITLIPIVLFAMVLPLSIGGWGLREGAAVALFPAFGATPAEGLAASVGFGLTILVSVLPGLVLASRGAGAAPPTRG